MSKELAIAVHNLSKVYKSSSDDAKLALDNISLSIKKGSISVSYTHLTLPTIYSV